MDPRYGRGLALLSLASLAVMVLAALAPAAYLQTTSNTLSGNVANVSIVSGASIQSSGRFFSPASITVVLGVNNTVVWTNNDQTTHTVTALDGSFSNTLSPGATFAHTFTAAGVYHYHCTIHSWMTGLVTVLAAPSSSTNPGSSGGIPVFPFEPLALVVITLLVIVSYLVVRQTKKG